jgi:uncharacterized repeat protein (TIGR01451 family)
MSKQPSSLSQRVTFWLVLTSLTLALLATQWNWSPSRAVPITQWNSTTALPEGLASGTTVTYGDFVYVVGGKNSSENGIAAIYGARIKADGGLENWAVVGQLPLPLYLHAAVVAGDGLFIIGGWDGQGTRAEVWRAPLLSDGRVGGWVAMPPYPSTLDLHDAVVFNNRIYVVGGWNGVQAQQAVYAAPLQGNGLGPWQRVGDLPQALYRLAITADSQRLFVTGGFTGNEIVSGAVYVAGATSDGALTAWQSYALPVPLFYHEALIHDNQLVILGGRDGDQVFNQVYTAAIDSNGTLGPWQSGPALPASIYRMGAVTVNRFGGDYIFVTAGLLSENEYQSAVYHSAAPPPPTPTPTPTVTPTPTPTPGLVIAIQNLPRHWIAPDGEVAYTISYQNQAPTQLTNVIITNRIPNAVELVEGSIRTAQGNFSNTGSKAGDLITWQLGAVSAGASGEVAYRARRPLPPTPAVPPALTIDLEAPVAVSKGNQATYRFTVKNNAPAALSGLVITNTLPYGAVYVSGGDSAPVNNIVRWSLPTLAADSSAVVELVVRATQSLVNYDYRVTSQDGPAARGRATAITLVDGLPPLYGDGVVIVNDGARVTWNSGGGSATLTSRGVSNPGFSAYLPLVRR